MDYLEVEKTIKKEDKTKYSNQIHCHIVVKIIMSQSNCKIKNILMILHFLTILMALILPSQDAQEQLDLF